jgi:hypothetical protein
MRAWASLLVYSVAGEFGELTMSSQTSLTRLFQRMGFTFYIEAGLDYSFPIENSTRQKPSYPLIYPEKAQS